MDGVEDVAVGRRRLAGERVEALGAAGGEDDRGVRHQAAHLGQDAVGDRPPDGALDARLVQHFRKDAARRCFRHERREARPSLDHGSGGSGGIGGREGTEVRRAVQVENDGKVAREVGRERGPNVGDGGLDGRGVGESGDQVLGPDRQAHVGQAAPTERRHHAGIGLQPVAAAVDAGNVDTAGEIGMAGRALGRVCRGNGDQTGDEGRREGRRSAHRERVRSSQSACGLVVR